MRRYVLAALMTSAAATAFGQAPPTFGPRQLDQMVARIALYPDPLLAQILAAATYSNDIPAAAQWLTSTITSLGRRSPEPSRPINCLGIPPCRRCSRFPPCWR